MIGIRVLGPLEVTVDGATADLGGPRQRCVLARLVAAQGRVVSADRLIEDLYADEAPPRALAAVQSYVSHLRRALEPARTARAQPNTLVTLPPGYALRLDRDAVDAWAFEDEVHRATGLTDAAAVHQRLSATLGAWHDSAFQEFGGLPWADLEAARLDELRLTAMERLADAALQLGRAAEVVPDLDRLAVEHPLREEAWRLLTLALYQVGRQGDALAALRHLLHDRQPGPLPPGARTNWRSHAVGQTLHVTDGIGLVVTRDGTVIRIRPGDSVYSPPGEEHWHGATEDNFMSHLAMLEGTRESDATTWLELVTDHQHKAASQQ